MLFVGGTALYLKALLRGLFSGPPANWELRHELEELARLKARNRCTASCKKSIPSAAAKLHPNDVRRMIRALEVHQTTGQPISRLQQQFENGRSADECRVFVLDWPREHSKSAFASASTKCSPPVWSTKCKQFQTLVCRLAPGQRPAGRGKICSPRSPTNHSPLSRTAGQAVGYREVLEHLQGLRDLPATIELVKLRTRQFAKRQLTWFRSLSECRWIRRRRAISIPPRSPTQNRRNVPLHEPRLNEPFANRPVDLE